MADRSIRASGDSGLFYYNSFGNNHYCRKEPTVSYCSPFDNKSHSPVLRRGWSLALLPLKSVACPFPHIWGKVGQATSGVRQDWLYSPFRASKIHGQPKLLSMPLQHKIETCKTSGKVSPFRGCLIRFTGFKSGNYCQMPARKFPGGGSSLFW